jgi:hypothetical protein
MLARSFAVAAALQPRRCYAAALVCGVSLLFTGAAEAGGDDPLGPAELARIDRGELVQRQVSEQRGDLRLIGGSSWQLIDAAPEVVWTALLDTAHYTRFLPQLAEARVVQEQGTNRTVYMRHNGVLAPSYFLALHIDESQHAIAFRLDGKRPHDIRAAWGVYNVRPYDEDGNRTLLAFGVRADIGDGLMTALMRGSAHEWMMKVPWMVKRFVEGSGRYLYAQQANEARQRLLAKGN